MEGFLTHKHVNETVSQRNFFRINRKDRCLEYFEDSTGLGENNVLLGSIKFESMTNINKDVMNPSKFFITLENETYQFEASTWEERCEWENTLKSIMAQPSQDGDETNQRHMEENAAFLATSRANSDMQEQIWRNVDFNAKPSTIQEVTTAPAGESNDKKIVLANGKEFIIKNRLSSSQQPIFTSMNRNDGEVDRYRAEKALHHAEEKNGACAACHIF